MARPKEPLFFASEYEDEAKAYSTRYLPHYNGEKKRGDAATGHLFLPWVPSRIHQVCPQARLVVLLRDPVERAWSEWWMHHSAGADPDPFPLAIEKALERLEHDRWLEKPDAPDRWRQRVQRMTKGLKHQPNPYLEPGFYLTHLQRYLELFPRTQILVLFTAHLRTQPEQTLSRLAAFLELPPGSLRPPTVLENRARGPVGNILNRLALNLRLHHIVPRPWIGRTRDLLRSLGDTPVPPDETSRQTLRELYRPHDQELRQFLETDLPWPN